MRPPRLSRRLRALVELIPREGVSVVADIGTDHGLVPAWLVASGVARAAIAIDRREAPLSAARRTMIASRVTDRVELRLGSGFEPLANDEADTVVVAGLGEPTIIDLVAGPRPSGIRRLVLQPNGDGRALRSVLAATHAIVDETLVRDRGRLYPIVVAQPQSPPLPLDLADQVLGPVLRHRRGADYEEWIARRLQEAQAHLRAERSARCPSRARLEELEQAVTIMEADQRRGA